MRVRFPVFSKLLTKPRQQFCTACVQYYLPSPFGATGWLRIARVLHEPGMIHASVVDGDQSKVTKTNLCGLGDLPSTPPSIITSIHTHTCPQPHRIAFHLRQKTLAEGQEYSQPRLRTELPRHPHPPIPPST